MTKKSDLVIAVERLEEIKVELDNLKEQHNQLTKEIAAIHLYMEDNNRKIRLLSIEQQNLSEVISKSNILT